MREGGLAAWVRFSAAMAAPDALLTLIHRPDCLGELIALLDGRFGDIVVFPLFPQAGGAATRILDIGEATREPLDVARWEPQLELRHLPLVEAG